IEFGSGLASCWGHILFQPVHGDHMDAPSQEATRAAPLILLIEDNPDGRETMRRFLRLRGYRVEASVDGPEGVDMGLSLHPDIAIVDIGLPGLDGFEVARRLRQSLGAALKLIAWTAYDSADDQQLAKKVGF